MVIGLQSQECIREISPVIADTLDQIAASVNTWAAVEHTSQGTHTSNVVTTGTAATNLATYVHIYLGGSRYHGVQVT
jgi:hypothetical protein